MTLCLYFFTLLISTFESKDIKDIMIRELLKTLFSKVTGQKVRGNIKCEIGKIVSYLRLCTASRTIIWSPVENNPDEFTTTVNGVEYLIALRESTGVLFVVNRSVMSKLSRGAGCSVLYFEAKAQARYYEQYSRQLVAQIETLIEKRRTIVRP